MATQSARKFSTVLGGVVRLSVVACASAALAYGPAQAAKLPAASARTSAAETHGFNPQPDPPGFQACQAITYYNQHVGACAPILLSKYPPGPCKSESYLEKHFRSCIGQLPR